MCSMLLVYLWKHSIVHNVCMYMYHWMHCRMSSQVFEDFAKKLHHMELSRDGAISPKQAFVPLSPSPLQEVRTMGKG